MIRSPAKAIFEKRHEEPRRSLSRPPPRSPQELKEDNYRPRAPSPLKKSAYRRTSLASIVSDYSTDVNDNEDDNEEPKPLRESGYVDFVHLRGVWLKETTTKIVVPDMDVEMLERGRSRSRSPCAKMFTSETKFRPPALPSTLRHVGRSSAQRAVAAAYTRAQTPPPEDRPSTIIKVDKRDPERAVSRVRLDKPTRGSGNPRESDNPFDSKRISKAPVQRYGGTSR